MSDFGIWLIDVGLGDHWPDAALAALFAFAIWIIQRGISRMESRHQRAEDNFKSIDTDIAVLKVMADVGGKMDRMVTAIERLADRK